MARDHSRKRDEMRWCEYHEESEEYPPGCFFLQRFGPIDESRRAVKDDDVMLTGEVISLRSSVGNGIASLSLKGSKSGIECNLAEIVSSLSDILEDLKHDGRRWVLILETTGEPVRYVQVLVTQDGGLWAECVSNNFLSIEDKLSDEQLEILPLLGWQWPSPPAGPNWQLHDELLNTGSAISGLLTRTLREVFGCANSDRVRFILFLSQDDEPLNGER
jgi:hypothetical protein